MYISLNGLWLEQRVPTTRNGGNLAQRLFHRINILLHGLQDKGDRQDRFPSDQKSKPDAYLTLRIIETSSIRMLAEGSLYEKRKKET